MHWRNSYLQIIAFIAEGCHTYDEAYRRLNQEREERDIAIKTTEAAWKRAEAKLLRAKSKLKSWRKVDRLEAEADIMEYEAVCDTEQKCYEQAVRDRDFYDFLIEFVEPKRKYRDLPDHVGYQLIQAEEWFLEFKTRIENFIYAGPGWVPPDELASMRLHPRWSELSIYIDQMRMARTNQVPLPRKESLFQPIVDGLLLVPGDLKALPEGKVSTDLLNVITREAKAVKEIREG